MMNHLIVNCKHWLLRMRTVSYLNKTPLSIQENQSFSSFPKVYFIVVGFGGKLEFK